MGMAYRHLLHTNCHFYFVNHYSCKSWCTDKLANHLNYHFLPSVSVCRAAWSTSQLQRALLLTRL